jgi:hypothetical protein
MGMPAFVPDVRNVRLLRASEPDADATRAVEVVPA